MTIESNHLRLVGAIARPLSEEADLDFEETDGTEEIIDWDELEYLLDTGEIATQVDLFVWIKAAYGAVDMRPHAYLRQRVLDGLFPEYREMCANLPEGESNRRYGLFTSDQVIEMRARYEAGETVTELARVFGVSRGPMRKILNYETYKEVA
jgi:hypothetical protein